MTAPWGRSTITNYTASKTVGSVTTPQTKGYVRAWKWLADEKADRSLVWGVQKSDTLNVLLYEMVDK